MADRSDIQTLDPSPADGLFVEFQQTTLRKIVEVFGCRATPLPEKYIVLSTPLDKPFDRFWLGGWS